ncbi:MAG: hypothetical protein E3J21_05245 [Anaerolineales bacterium]|nr:MAG: hypothetical protein E3J21_05245 [Anaerolineales bacterium]
MCVDSTREAFITVAPLLHRLYRSSDATVVIAVQAIQVIISLAEQGISDGKHREGIVEAVLYVERKR